MLHFRKKKSKPPLIITWNAVLHENRLKYIYDTSFFCFYKASLNE